MTDRELASAARRALAHIDDESELEANPLVTESDRPLPYESLRAAVLGALESLAAVEAIGGAAAQKQRRLHGILVRCDLHGEAHKCVIDAMGLSRRQFYRERHEALLHLAAAIRRSLKHNRTSWAAIELGDAAEAYIEALRSAGQYHTVWREASALATRAADEPREVKLWMVASEAARYVADTAAAVGALEQAHAAAHRSASAAGSYARTLWIAIGEMNVQWAAADCEGARATFDRAARMAPDEWTLQGSEAILFGIMLCYAATMECDCGRWERARTLLDRAFRMAERGQTGTTRSSLLKISGQLALRAQGDTSRSIADYHAALGADCGSGQLGRVAVSAVYYASALCQRDAVQALPYAEYGIETARRFYPGDGLAKLLLESVPLILPIRGSSSVRQAVADARRAKIDLRDSLFLDLAEAKIALHAGADRIAVERADDVALRLAQRGIGTWACDARLVAIEGYAKLGQRHRARRRLAEIADALAAAGADVRARARRLGTLLALSG